jgi:nicotinate-nucleotide adenylyltransferase
MMTDRGPVVGVLGGSFDPVHLGHLAAAEHTRRALGLQRMLLLPTAVPPHKPRGSLSQAEHREAMLRLAIEGREGLEICRHDLAGDDVRFTIDTLRMLRDADPVCQPVFVLGMDALLEIETWRDYREVLVEFDFVVLDRPGQRLSEIRSRVPPAAAVRLVEIEGDRPGVGVGGRIFHLPFEPIPISSSEIRSRVALGLELDGLVPPPVARYIRDAGLYRETGGSSLSIEAPPEIGYTVAAALDKKAEDVVVLDLRGLSDVTDFFVVCHGSSDRQVHAIVESIQERLLRELNLKAKHLEGLRSADWVLMDYVDLVVHVFLDERRKFYRLERLWGDARSLDPTTLEGADEPRSDSA